MKIPTLSTRSERLRKIALVLAWLGLMLFAVAIAVTITYAR